MKILSEPIVVANGLEFPEGPAYDGKGNIYTSNCDSDYITRVDAVGNISIAYRASKTEAEPLTFRKTNGMTFFKEGSLFVCDFGRNAIVRIYPDGHQEVVVGEDENEPLAAPNDLAFAPNGDLYFTAPGQSDKANPIGRIYRWQFEERRLTRVAEQMAYPNGLAFSATGEWLYVAESKENRILRFAVRSDGALGPQEVFADLSAFSEGEPDGIALDSAGNLWIAHFYAHLVLVLSPSGDLLEKIPLPFEKQTGPTNVEFAGADLCQVYITDPGSESLYRLTTDTPGLSLFCAPTMHSA